MAKKGLNIFICVFSLVLMIFLVFSFKVSEKNNKKTYESWVFLQTSEENITWTYGYRTPSINLSEAIIDLDNISYITHTGYILNESDKHITFKPDTSLEYELLFYDINFNYIERSGWTSSSIYNISSDYYCYVINIRSQSGTLHKFDTTVDCMEYVSNLNIIKEV